MGRAWRLNHPRSGLAVSRSTVDVEVTASSAMEPIFINCAIWQAYPSRSGGTSV